MKIRILLGIALSLVAVLLVSKAQVITFLGTNPVYANDGTTLRSCPVQVNYSLTTTVDGITATAQRSITFDATDAKNPVTIDDVSLTPVQWFKFAEAFAAREVPAKKQQEQAARAAADAAAEVIPAPPPEK